MFRKGQSGHQGRHPVTPDADYQNRLSTALRGGRGPDIAQLKAYGELQPSSRRVFSMRSMTACELKNFPEAALGGARSRADGKLYGVPYSVPMMGSSQ
jgi:raffinose/stachyose/melibiose transport system substrate-binding protein